jgi:hypothetical protein
LGKSVTLADTCYEWNTKAEIVHVEAISSVVALTSSSPLAGRFSAFQKKKPSALAAETNVPIFIQGVSGGIVNILGGGSMGYSE